MPSTAPATPVGDGVLEPQPPLSWRPRSARSRKAHPQAPSSFLEQTLSKLHGDSSRAGVEGLPFKQPLPPAEARPERPEACPRRADASDPSRPFAAVEIERWRKVFAEEAQTAVRAMRAVVEDSNLSRIASMLDTWHESGSNEVTQLREHVEELLKLNCSLRQNTLDQLSTDEFVRLRSSVVDMSDRLDELMVAQRRGHGYDLGALAEQTAERAVETLSSDVTSLAALWHRGCDEQRECRRDDEERWAKVLGHLERVQERLGRLEASFGNQSDMLRVDAEMVNRQALKQLDARLQKEMEEERSQLTRQITGALREEVGGLLEGSVPRFADLVEGELRGSREALLRKVEAASAEGRRREQALTQAVEELRAASRRRDREDVEDNTLSATAFGDALRELHQRLDRMDGDYREEVRCWRREAEKQGDHTAKARTELEVSRTEAKAREAEAERLAGEGRELRGQLQSLQEEIESSTAIPASELLRKIKELEARKNIRIDLKSATVETVKNLDFEIKKTSEGPEMVFKDSRLAERVLRDIAELAMLLSAPLVVESYAKGNNPDAAAQSASSRAALVKEQLKSLGVEEELMGTKGVAGNKNSKGPSLIIRFDVFSMPA